MIAHGLTAWRQLTGRLWLGGMFLLVAALSAGVSLAGPATPADTKVYVAKRIITMDTARPDAKAVAVRERKIIAVGSLEEVRKKLDGLKYEVDKRFADKVLLPGFIDNHVHPMLVGGFLLQTKFITPFDWSLPTGQVKGVRSREGYLTRLREIEAAMDDDGEWLWSWGYQRNFHGELTRKDLDAISNTRPILIWGRSFHEIVLNTPALKAIGFLGKDDPRHAQIDWDKGLAMEAGFKQYILPKLAGILMQPERILPTLETIGQVLHMGGITTTVDMAAGATNVDREWQAQQAVYEKDDTPFRVLYVPLSSKLIADRHGGFEKAAEFFATLPQRNTRHMKWLDKQVKFLADGAFFSQLMQMKDGYTDGHEGEWIMPPDELKEAAEVFWKRGWQIHTHVNGDLGMEVVLDLLGKLEKDHPRKDHRFTLHHVGYFTKDQAERIGTLNASVSAQPYYLYTMGEIYARQGLGQDRAHHMLRLKSLLDNSVRLSLHSDFTMAPAEPLKLAWVAVNRLSANGKVLAPEERISVDQALRAITIDAAYAIRMEDQIGSIETGKMADFTVLDQDPHAVPAEQLKDIPVWGTVFEGEVYPVGNAK